jgi:hypothetical protein
MIREILTLIVDEQPTQYYINFEKDRKLFSFQPTLKSKAAPSFTIEVTEGDLLVHEQIQEDILSQASEKVREILSNMIFDKI